MLVILNFKVIFSYIETNVKYMIFFCIQLVSRAKKW